MALRVLTGTTASNVIRGLSVAEEILGLAGDDQLYGGGDNDRIVGGLGNDLLAGEDGNDVLVDAEGIDIYQGGAGFDTVDYSVMTTGRGVDVFLQLGYGGRDALGDTYSSIENITGTKYQDFLWGDDLVNVIDGGAGNDFIRGFGGNDVLVGGDGNDELYGDGGADVFRPGWGQDIIVGGDGYDRVDLSGEMAGITVNFIQNQFSGPLDMWGNPDGDQIYVEGLTATRFDDNIDLTGQVNWTFTMLDGGAGNDILKGAVSFYGGLGEDTVRFTNGKFEQIALQLDKGIDKVVGMNRSDGDRMFVSRSEFGLNTDATGKTIVQWVDTLDKPHANAAQASFIYEKSTQILWFDGDGTGSAKAPIAVAGFYGLPVDSTGATIHPVLTDLVFIA
jgi:Ca2+-binding RTX toxin-like protein